MSDRIVYRIADESIVRRDSLQARQFIRRVFVVEESSAKLWRDNLRVPPSTEKQCTCRSFESGQEPPRFSSSSSSHCLRTPPGRTHKAPKSLPVFLGSGSRATMVGGTPIKAG